jgi:hypothetical protein
LALNPGLIKVGKRLLNDLHAEELVTAFLTNRGRGLFRSLLEHRKVRASFTAVVANLPEHELLLTGPSQQLSIHETGIILSSIKALVL